MPIRYILMLQSPLESVFLALSARAVISHVQLDVLYVVIARLSLKGSRFARDCQSVSDL